MPADRPAGSVPEEPPLEATIAVEPDATAGCPIVSETPEALAVTQTLSCEVDGRRSCRLEATVEDGSARTIHLSSTVVPECVCPAIAASGCVFSIDSVSAGAIVFSILVRDRETVTEIVAAIRDAGGTVQLQAITPFEVDTGVRFDVETSEITDKQREALELAVELGYYDDPRRADLGELADRLEITRSAVSQRLNAAEAKVVRSLVSQ